MEIERRSGGGDGVLPVTRPQDVPDEQHAEALRHHFRHEGGGRQVAGEILEGQRVERHGNHRGDQDALGQRAAQEGIDAPVRRLRQDEGGDRGRGDGGVWGPFFGVLSFALLFVVMTMLGVGDPGKLIFQGLIILFAAIFYGLRRR